MASGMLAACRLCATETSSIQLSNHVSFVLSTMSQQRAKNEAPLVANAWLRHLARIGFFSRIDLFARIENCTRMPGYMAVPECQDIVVRPNARILSSARMPGYILLPECQDTFFCPIARKVCLAGLPGYILLPECQDRAFHPTTRIHQFTSLFPNTRSH